MGKVTGAALNIAATAVAGYFGVDAGTMAAITNAGGKKTKKIRRNKKSKHINKKKKNGNKKTRKH